MTQKFLLPDDTLWDFADGLLTAAEANDVSAQIARDPQLRARFDVVLAEKRALASLPLERPSANFADQVMAAWAAEQAVKVVAKAAAKPASNWGLWAILLGFVGLAVAPAIWLAGHPSQGIKLPKPNMDVPLVLQKLDLVGFLTSPVMLFGTLTTLALLGVLFLEKIWRVRHLNAQ